MGHTEEPLHDIAHRTLVRCDVLAAFSEEPDRLTRTFLTPPMRGVHQCLTEWMTRAGLSVRRDALGNLIGRYPARAEPAPALLLGSHLDTVPVAGKYDGVLGVLLALAAVEALGGRRLPFALEVIGFSEEEGVRFRRPYLGSLAVVGQFDDALLRLRDAGGVTVAQAIEAFGEDPAAVARAAYDPAQVLGYLEAHIEQGPVLEERGVPLGVVEVIVGQTRVRLRFTGSAGHAGTTPMPSRRDALACAAEFVLAVEAVGWETPGLAATVGAVAVTPNVPNVIPGDVEVSLDARHREDGQRRRAVEGLLVRAQQIAARRGLTCRVVSETHEPATPMDAGLQGLLSRAMAEAGLPASALVSGAGHDAVILARLIPAAMLMLRSPGGLSHHPDERVLLEDVEAALEVLRRSLLLLAEQRDTEVEIL